MSQTREELSEYLARHTDIGDAPDSFDTDCKNAVYLLENCEITLDEKNFYFVRVNCEGLQGSVIWRRADKLLRGLGDPGFCELYDGQASMAYTGTYDFGHTSPEWDTVLRLGIYGLRSRLGEYRAKYADDEARRSFYDGCSSVYDAALGFMRRAAGKASESGRANIAEGLYNLCAAPPENLFEAMQTILAYYTLQHVFDGTSLRTLGRLDSTLYPFFKKEDAETARSELRNFIAEIDSMKPGANIPFALGGSDTDGKCLFNELSLELLDAYQTVPNSNVKLHLLCPENTPEGIVEKAFRGIRDGRNSIAFMSDGTVIKALTGLGAEYADAVDYHVVGCYECGASDELTCSCNARVSIPKALEAALNGGRDMLTGKLIGLANNGGFESFDELFFEFRRQLLYLTGRAMALTDAIEERYAKLHSSPALSAVYSSSMRRGGDIYRDRAAKYNDSSVNALGIGTAVDSLAAIRKLVYEEKSTTLGALTEILKSDFKSEEALRLRLKNKYPKYGAGDKKTDLLAARTVELLGRAVDGRPNVKGGVWRLGTFSIDWRWEFGKHTAASADGRHSGETISQNTSATFGSDKEGATAHLLSAASIDTSLTPNGSIVDIDLHSSAVAGENGLEALSASLKTYFELGGFAVHYNVLDTAALERARLHPEEYPNLQVRLCGWNVLFSSLSDREKDEFIARSKNG